LTRCSSRRMGPPHHVAPPRRRPSLSGEILGYRAGSGSVLLMNFSLPSRHREEAAGRRRFSGRHKVAASDPCAGATAGSPWSATLPAVALDELNFPSPRTPAFFPRHCERPKGVWQSRAVALWPWITSSAAPPRNDGGEVRAPPNISSSPISHRVAGFPARNDG